MTNQIIIGTPPPELNTFPVIDFASGKPDPASHAAAQVTFIFDTCECGKQQVNMWSDEKKIRKIESDMADAIIHGRPTINHQCPKCKSWVKMPVGRSKEQAAIIEQQVKELIEEKQQFMSRNRDFLNNAATQFPLYSVYLPLLDSLESLTDASIMAIRNHEMVKDIVQEAKALLERQQQASILIEQKVRGALMAELTKADRNAEELLKPYQEERDRKIREANEEYEKIIVPLKADRAAMKKHLEDHAEAHIKNVTQKLSQNFSEDVHAIIKYMKKIKGSIAQCALNTRRN